MSILILIFFIIANDVKSQKSLSELKKDTIVVYQNSIYLELGGSGVDYSLNYDRMIYYSESKAVSLRVGGKSSFGIGETDDLLLTAGGYYLTGFGDRFFEMGVAPIYSKNFSNSVEDRNKVFVMLSFGYRKQPTNKNDLIWRMAFTPLIDINNIKQKLDILDYVIPWGGISVGFGF